MPLHPPFWAVQEVIAAVAKMASNAITIVRFIFVVFIVLQFCLVYGKGKNDHQVIQQVTDYRYRRVGKFGRIG